MARDFALSFYHSPAWVHNRNAYLQKTLDTPYGIIPPGMCERCFERGELTPAKVVHHKVHLTPENINDPRIALGFDNFQRLCQDCHATVHSGRAETRARFDADGNLVGAVARHVGDESRTDG